MKIWGNVSRIDKMRVARKTVCILAGRGLPICESEPIDGIKAAGVSARSVCKKDVVISCQPGGIRARTADLDRVMLAGAGSVAAGVHKNIIAIRSGRPGDAAVEGERICTASDAGSADVDAVMEEVICAGYLVDACDRGAVRDACAEGDDVVLERGRSVST